MSKIQNVFLVTSNYANNIEAWNMLNWSNLDVKRPFQNGKEDSHIVAAGDVLIKGKTYRLSLWTDRLYIAQEKIKSKTAKHGTHLVHRDIYRCMICVQENFSSETQVSTTILSCVSDFQNSLKADLRAWDPKNLTFEPIE